MEKLNDDQKRMIDGRLLHWAAAYAGGGFGAQLQMSSMFSMLTAEPGGSDYVAQVPIDDRAEEINTAVNNLPGREQRVVYEYYVVTESTAEQKYRAAGLSKATFSRVKNNAMLLIYQELESNKRAIRKII